MNISASFEVLLEWLDDRMYEFCVHMCWKNAAVRSLILGLSLGSVLVADTWTDNYKIMGLLGLLQSKHEHLVLVLFPLFCEVGLGGQC